MYSKGFFVLLRALVKTRGHMGLRSYQEGRDIESGSETIGFYIGFMMPIKGWRFTG